MPPPTLNYEEPVSVGPLSGIPVRLHERPSMLICALDELKVLRGCNLNLHAVTLSVDHRLLPNIPTMRS